MFRFGLRVHCNGTNHTNNQQNFGLFCISNQDKYKKEQQLLNATAHDTAVANVQNALEG